MEHALPTQADVDGYLANRNWGRWGPDDQVGAINLITPEKRVQAAGLVKSGRLISLSRMLPKIPGPGNSHPVQHWMGRVGRGDDCAGTAHDSVSMGVHGIFTTHIDALCHVWENDGMWNGRDPDEQIQVGGSQWGSIDHWGDGIVTRGIMFDVPRHRGVPYVTMDEPVHGWELEEIAEANGVRVEPGDAVVVHCGREQWEAEHGPWGVTTTDGGGERPGLHVSCLDFLRKTDTAVLVWDMHDHMPNDYGLIWAVHGAIWAYGVALVDTALLEPLADACHEEKRVEFQLCLAPLRLQGGTGSPLNPLALL